MFTLRHYSTKSSEWQDTCCSEDPRSIIRTFDELMVKNTVPAIELVAEQQGEERVLRLGLSREQLMKLAVQECRLPRGASRERERFEKLRARGVRKVREGRNEVLDAMVF